MGLVLTDVFPNLYFKFRDRPWQKTTAIWFFLGIAGKMMRNYDMGMKCRYGNPSFLFNSSVAPLTTLAYGIGFGIGGYFYHFIRIEVLKNDYYEKVLAKQKSKEIEQEMLKRKLVIEPMK